jgi:glycosyltransferase involved in cell wall biosynthesis
MLKNDTIRNVRFSIITPVFNREDCIERCVRSVAEQGFGSVEQLIVDDGSTDGTVALARQCAETYPFVHFFSFDRNRGVNAARNKAISESRGDFVLFLDSDDILAPEALVTIDSEICANGSYRHYLFATNDRADYYAGHPLLGAGTAELSFGDFLTGKVSGDFAHVVAREIIAAYPFDEELRIYEYVNFLRMFREEGRQLFVGKIALLRDRGRHDSVTKESLLSARQAFVNQYSANSKTLSLFAEDYRRLGATAELAYLINRTYILGTALGLYDETRSLAEDARKQNIDISATIRIINALRLGRLLRFAISLYSKIKNRKA